MGDTMKRLTALTFVLLALTAGLATRAATAAPQASKAATRQQTVTIDNFSFNAKSVTVAVGTEVTWVNHDDAPHKVVSSDQKFASPVLDTDGRFSHTFSTPGTYAYYCSLHPMMTGTIVVK
jgi:plastocyanin